MIAMADQSGTRDTPLEALFRRFGRRSDRHQITVRLLGPIEVRGTWGDVVLGSREELTILVLLALHLNQVVSEGRIVEAVWGEDTPSSARASCGSFIAGLRLVLTGAGRGLRIEAERSGFRLVGDKGAVDVSVVRDLVHQADKAMAAEDPSRAIALLTSASGAWRGRALGDLAGEPWAARYTQELEDLRLQILEQRFEAELDCGRHAEVLPELRALAIAHPLRESVSSQLMLALFRSGRLQESLAVYSRFSSDLAHQLGAEPSPHLTALRHRIATKDTSVEWKAEAGNFPVEPYEEQQELPEPQGEIVYSTAAVEQLRTVPALSGLNARQLSKLVRLVDVVNVKPGQLLTQEGKFGQQAFIVLDGSAEVIISGNLRRTVGPGEFIGEMAMIDRQPRSATVVAKTPMRLAVIGPTSWSAFMDEPGVSRAVAVQLARRLRLADQEHFEGAGRSAEPDGLTWER